MLFVSFVSVSWRFSPGMGIIGIAGIADIGGIAGMAPVLGGCGTLPGATPAGSAGRLGNAGPVPLLVAACQAGLGEIEQQEQKQAIAEHRTVDHGPRLAALDRLQRNFIGHSRYSSFGAFSASPCALQSIKGDGMKHPAVRTPRQIAAQG